MQSLVIVKMRVKGFIVLWDMFGESRNEWTRRTVDNYLLLRTYRLPTAHLSKKIFMFLISH